MSRIDEARAAELEAFRRLQAERPDERELARRRAAGAQMDKIRVKVGGDFNVVDVLRQLRDGASADAKTARPDE